MEVPKITFAKAAVILLLCMLIGMSIAFARLYSEPKSYKASLDFIVNEDAGVGGIASLLGNSTIGSILGKSENNIDQLIAIATSDAVLIPVLNDTVEFNGELEKIIDIIATEYTDDVDENIRKINEELTVYLSGDNEIRLNAVQDLMYSSENNVTILSTEYDDKSGIIRIIATSTNPALSELLVNAVYDKLSNYYVSKRIAPQQITYNNLKSKVDSFSNIISTINLNIAEIRDTRRNITSERSKLLENKLRSDLSINMVAYGKVLENFEYSDFILRSKTPYLSVLNRPSRPLLPESKSYFLTMILYGVTTLLIGLVSLYSYELYRAARIAQ